MIQIPWLGLLDLLFPRNCILCRTYDKDIINNPVCPRCRNTILFNFPPFCAKCSRHLDQVSEDGLCRDCRRHFPLFDTAWGFTLYEEPLRTLIHSFKFQNKTALRKTFFHITKEFLLRYKINLNDYSFIIPMPLTPTRMRERGYNQSLLLAEGLSELTGIPCLKDNFIRSKHTPRQSDLEKKERWTNVHGAFKMNTSSLIQEKNILLVDDLLTTGATASEAARTLKNAGASRVGVVVLAMA